MMRGMISSGFMEGHGDVIFARWAYSDDDNVSRLLLMGEEAVESLAFDLSSSKAANNASSLLSS